MFYFLLVSLLFRLIGFNTSAIWYDESISLFRVQHWIPSNLWEMILTLFTNGGLWVFRLPALICSLIALWFAWKIMDHFSFTRYQRIISCLLLCVLPGLVWISHDARCYSAYAALYMAAIYFGLKDKPQIMIVSLIGLCLIHPTGVIYAISAIMLSLFTIRIKYIVIAYISLLAVIPGALFAVNFYSQSSNPFWLQKIDLINSLGLAAFSNTVPAIIGGLVMLIIILWSAFNKDSLILSLSVLVPIIGLLMASIIYMPVLFYRTITPLLIPICLLIGYGPHISNDKRRLIPAALFSFVLLVSLANWDPSTHGGHVDDLADLIDYSWQDGDQIVYATGTLALPFDYYMDHKGCILDWSNGNLTHSYLDLPPCTDELSNGKRTWVIWTDDPILNQPAPPGGQLIGISTGSWQISTIYVYLFDN